MKGKERENWQDMVWHCFCTVFGAGIAVVAAFCTALSTWAGLAR